MNLMKQSIMSKKIIFIALLAALLFATAGIGIFISTLFAPVVAESAESVQFVIARGQSVTQIANQLHQAGLVKHPLAFRLAVKWQGLDNQIQAGSFQLSPSLTVMEIAQSLTLGSEDQWVTIPEGWRAEEIAAAFSHLPEFNQAEFISDAVPLEGQLFPDTYLMPQHATAEDVLGIMHLRFTEIMEENDILAKAQAQELTLDEVVIIASLLEREAKTLRDMRIVSGILSNRLEIGMALQVDATLQYAKGFDEQNQTWWAPPQAKDKEINSPFNTYLYPGLPPNPISNPGLNALLAAVEPTPSNYLYYITAPDGTMYYSETYEQHLANIQQYLR